MRIVYLLFIMTLTPNLFIGQCCPYIDSVEIIPAIPNDGEETTVVLTVTTPNIGGFISATSELDGFNLIITACYWWGDATSLDTHVHTINIGVLPAGNYAYEFTAQQSDDVEICAALGSQIQTGEFEVEMVNSVSENEISKVLIYPNPIQDNILNLKSVFGLQMLEIIDANGKVLIHNEYKGSDSEVAINLEGLNSGVYLVNVFFADDEQTTSKIVIE